MVNNINIMWPVIPISNIGGTVLVGTMYGLLSKNTRADELEWRITWFDEIQPIDHVAVSCNQVDELIRNRQLTITINFIEVIVTCLKE